MRAAQFIGVTAHCNFLHHLKPLVVRLLLRNIAIHLRKMADKSRQPGSVNATLYSWTAIPPNYRQAQLDGKELKSFHPFYGTQNHTTSQQHAQSMQNNMWKSVGLKGCPDLLRLLTSDHQREIPVHAAADPARALHWRGAGAASRGWAADTAPPALSQHCTWGTWAASPACTRHAYKLPECESLL